MKSSNYIRILMVCVIGAFFAFNAFSQTTIKVRVNHPDDDAEEITHLKVEPYDTLAPDLPPGDVDLHSSDLELGTETAGAPQIIGMIFRDVQIPVGATITNAYVQFHVDSDNDEEITNTIFGTLLPNIDSTFKDELFNISSYPRTVDSVMWSPPPWLHKHEEGPDQQTSDITPLINEIIALDGWAPGNSLMITITNPTMEKLHREAESYDGEPESAPQLVVTFTYTPTTTIEVRVNHPDDDAEEITHLKVEPYDTLAPDLPPGDVDLHSSDLELGTETAGAPQIIGMIFRDVQIPPGANIRNAYVQFHVDSDNDEEITNTIFGTLQANIDSTFKDELFNISSYPRTVDSVMWSPPPWLYKHEEGPDQRTPDITPLINEIIALDGWESGNSLMITITNPTMEKLHREAESYDGEPESAPKLVVEFDEIPNPLEITIADGMDDVEELINPASPNFGKVDAGSSDLELGRDKTTADGDGAQAVGLRYMLPVGHGATISDAYLQFSADQASAGPLTLSIYAEASAHAEAFTEDSANVTSRIATTAQVEWTPFDWETQHAVADSQRTVDISPVIQEVVSQYEWVHGNALVLVLTPTDVSDEIGFREAGSFEDSGDPAPTLFLSYVGGAPPPPSSDATLASLVTSLGTLAPTFDPAVLDYTADGPLGTTEVTLTATATDPNATVEAPEKVSIVAGSGMATIVVTAEDGVSTQTYTINITVDNTGIEVAAVNRVRMHYNSLSDRLMIFNAAEVERVEVYSLTGALIVSERVYQQETLELSTAALKHGLYVVRMKLSSNELQTGKFVK